MTFFLNHKAKLYGLVLLQFVIAICNAQSVMPDSVSVLVRKCDTVSLNKVFKNNPLLINEVNSKGHTPLILAAYKGNIGVVKFLIGKGADLNLQANEGTALHGASYKGCKEIVFLLLQSGAQVNLQDRNGTTPLMYATFSGNLEVASLLLKSGAIITLEDRKGKTALDFAKGANNKELVSLLEKNNQLK